MSFRGTRNLHKKLDIVLFFIKLPQRLSFRGTRNLRKKLDIVLFCTKFSQALSFRGTRNLHKKLDVVLFLTSCHNVCPSEERGISTSNSIQFCYSLAEMKNYFMEYCRGDSSSVGRTNSVKKGESLRLLYGKKRALTP